MRRSSKGIVLSADPLHVGKGISNPETLCTEKPSRGYRLGTSPDGRKENIWQFTIWKRKWLAGARGAPLWPLPLI